MPILLISAYDWGEIEGKAKEAGITGFISKPLFKSTLFNSLRQFAQPLQEGEKPPEQKGPDLRGRRVLVAEDNELNQEIAMAILEDSGFTVEVAGNGKIAVEKLEASETGYYQLVLMDVQMPVMNGYEATKAIRSLKNQDLATIPIIAMTANAFEEDKQEAIRCGMNGHIAKPIDVDVLFETLRKMLS